MEDEDEDGEAQMELHMYSTLSSTHADGMLSRSAVLYITHPYIKTVA